MRDSSCCVAPAARGLTLRASSVGSGDRAWSLPWVRSTPGSSAPSAARLSRRWKTAPSAGRAATSATRTLFRAPRRSASTSEGRVLLGRRAFDPGQGLWDLPGGFLHEDEHPLDGAAARDPGRDCARDRAGRLPRVLARAVRRTDRALPRVDARAYSGEARAGDDLVELRWFEPDEPACAARSSPSRTTRRCSQPLSAGGTSTRSAPGSILNSIGVSSTSGSPSIAASSDRVGRQSTTKRSPTRSGRSAPGT